MWRIKKVKEGKGLSHSETGSELIGLVHAEFDPFAYVTTRPVTSAKAKSNSAFSS